MDNLVMHLGQLPRRTRGGSTVQHVGYLPRKTNPIDTRFSSFNVSFILSGGGFYTVEGRTVTIDGPCVITQWEGAHFHYGQDERLVGWEELFFILPSSVKADFAHRGLWSPEQYWWPIDRVETTRMLATEVIQLMRTGDGVSVVDLIERLLEAMLVASLGTRYRNAASSDTRLHAIARLREGMAGSPQEPVDWDKAAQTCGCSLSTFRRLWIQLVGLPPMRYLIQLRIQEAARLLLETDAPVAEVAASVGVEDPLYFSRLFQQHTGEAPSLYRQRKRLLFLKSENPES